MCFNVYCVYKKIFNISLVLQVIRSSGSGYTHVFQTFLFIVLWRTKIEVLFACKVIK